MKLPSLHRLKNAFALTDDGVLVRSNPRSKKSKDGRTGTSVSSDGYRYVGLDYKKYPEHRIVWALFHNKIPETSIDHIDGNKSNNHPSNLRLCSQSQNRQNINTPRANTTGVTGVYLEKRTKFPSWYAQIKVGKERINLGTFDSLDKAVAARREAELSYFGEFAPTYKENI